MKSISPEMQDRIHALRSAPERLARVKNPAATIETTPEELVRQLSNAVHLERVGEALAKLRAVRGLSARELGKRVGLSQPRVSALEAAANAEVATLLRFANEAEYDVMLVPRNASDPAFVIAGEQVGE